MSQDTGLFSVKRPREVCNLFVFVAKTFFIDKCGLDTRERPKLLFYSTAIVRYEAAEFHWTDESTIYLAAHPLHIPNELGEQTSTAQFHTYVHRWSFWSRRWPLICSSIRVE